MKPLILVVLMAATPAMARAQDEAGLRPHHLAISVGAASSGGYDIGMKSAQLRGNGIGATPPPFTLFSADSRVTRVTDAELRIEYAVLRRLAVELAVAPSRPSIAVSISGDPEAPNQQLPGEQLRQYRVDGGVTWQLPIAARRFAPFASGGVAYLRQLHEDRTLGETGQIYYAGGGARYWLRGGDARSTSVGLRADIRVNVRRGGIDFADAVRRYPTFGVSVFLGL